MVRSRDEQRERLRGALLRLERAIAREWERLGGAYGGDWRDVVRGSDGLWSSLDGPISE